jgi:predicted transposase YbfD/YdcC
VRKWVAEYVREQLGIPNCRSVIRLDKEIRREGKTLSLETRYYISSLDSEVVSASDFQAYILGHWEIENCLHGAKDRFYDEDKHVCGSDWGQAFSVLTNMALSLVQLLRKGERTLREVREKCQAKPSNAARKFGIKKNTC